MIVVGVEAKQFLIVLDRFVHLPYGFRDVASANRTRMYGRVSITPQNDAFQLLELSGPIARSPAATPCSR